MLIRLIAVDLDGTLLKDDQTLSQENVLALQEAARQGIVVVLASARHLQSIQEYATQLAISQPVIVADGAQIFAAPHGDLWQEFTIPRDVAHAIATFADAHNWELTTLIGSRIYYKQRPDQLLGEFAPGQIICKTNTDSITQAPLRMLAHESEAISAISEYCLDSEFVDIRLQRFYHSNGQVRSLCIFPRQADKGHALQFLCQKLNIHPSQTMAIGDNDNDLPMFEVAGISVGMGNALDYITIKADIVVPSNEDNGVAG